ncbi:hypothetical protein D3C71_1987550 [compost metagenome]
MDRAVGIHVAVSDQYQLGAELPKGTGTFREFDVVANQDAYTQALPQCRDIAVTRLEQTTLRWPQVGLAVAQGDTFGSHQH